MAEHESLDGRSPARIEAELEERFTPFLLERGFDLFEVTFRRERRGMVLRFTVDRVGGGLTVNEGVKLSRDLSAAIDADPRLDQLLSGPYNLEVSSPGIFRPLKRAKDFERSWGKRIKVWWEEPGEGRILESVGYLAGYGEGKLTLTIDGKELVIAAAAVQNARLEPELMFDKNKAKKTP